LKIRISKSKCVATKRIGLGIKNHKLTTTEPTTKLSKATRQLNSTKIKGMMNAA
jgi:hypothetical protein